MSEEGLDATLLELLDRVIDKGVVIRGDIVISVAGVDLIYLGLHLLLASADKAGELRPSTEAPVAL